MEKCLSPHLIASGYLAKTKQEFRVCRLGYEGRSFVQIFDTEIDEWKSIQGTFPALKNALDRLNEIDDLAKGSGVA